jgi:hypothetical protein
VSVFAGGFLLEEGIVKLVSSDPGVAALCPNGGYLLQLPDGTTLPSWTYQIISDPPDYTLVGERYTMIHYELDCYADPDGANMAIRLARAIDSVLDGFKGTLGDIDQTVVHACFRADRRDFFNPEARNYRRMLEYDIHYRDARLGT